MAAPMQVDEAVPGDSSKLKLYTSSMHANMTSLF